MACFRSCHRRHWIRYELGVRPEKDDLIRRVGSAFAAAVEAHSKDGDVESAITERIEDPFQLALVISMFTGHLNRWMDDPIEHVASELEFDIPIVNPKTDGRTPTFRLCGKIDRIVRLADGRLAVMEYKTTSRDFSPGADYWLRLHMDPQLPIYVLAAREIGYDIETILYDVTRRPAFRPLKATPEEKRKYTAGGALYANQRENDGHQKNTPRAFRPRSQGSQTITSPALKSHGWNRTSMTVALRSGCNSSRFVQLSDPDTGTETPAPVLTLCPVTICPSA